MSDDVGQIPEALTSIAQWVLWKHCTRDGKATKLPFRPSGQCAKSNDASTWSDFPTVRAAAGFEGVGFVFSEADDFCGIDLDGCRNSETGAVSDWATRWITAFNSYAEVSPSQTGVKVFVRGRLQGTGKKASVDQPPVSAREPGVEAYDRRRYFAVTGQRLPDSPETIEHRQDVIDAFCAEYFPTRSLTVTAPRPSGTDVEDRAAKYLAKVPPAISGSGGHNATFRTACILVLGFNLSPERAFPLLNEWNEGCQPPWTDKELWHKLHDADKQQGERGWLLDGRGYTGPDVELRQLLESLECSTSVEPEPDFLTPRLTSVDDNHHIPAFPEWTLKAGGIIEELMRHTLRTSLYAQPTLAFTGALALVATVIGRKVRDYNDTRSNLYFLALSPSGCGKDQARKINKRLLVRAGCEHLIGPEKIGSHAGLISAVVEQPSMLLQTDEVSRLLVTAKDGRTPHLYNIITVLLGLFSDSDSTFLSTSYADTTKKRAVEQPNTVLFGTATPVGFWESLSKGNLIDGLVNRFLIFEVGYVETKARALEKLPESLVDWVKGWCAKDAKPDGEGNLTEVYPDPVICGYGDEARERIENHRGAIAHRRMTEDLEQAAVWSRTAEKAAKLALIFAASRADGPEGVTVTLDDANRAIAIANWSTRLTAFHAGYSVADSPVEKARKKVLRVIREHGPLTRRQLTRRVQSLRRQEREEVMRDLIEAGSITAEEVQTKTVPTIVYAVANPSSGDRDG